MTKKKKKKKKKKKMDDESVPAANVPEVMPESMSGGAPNAPHSQARPEGFEAEKPLVCFTVMPGGSKGEYQNGEKESEHVFKNIINKGIECASREIGRHIASDREVDRAMPGSITKSIIRSLCSADFVVADITGRNPNVFLELGIRYSVCRSGTILLRQEEEEIPFDIANFKALTYHKFETDSAAERIAEFIVNIATNSPADSPVYDATKLEVYVDGVSKSGGDFGESQLMMPWSEIMQRIDQLAFYKKYFQEGKFRPTALIGITNGGVMIAEIISRKYFHGVPLISLWADRWSSDALVQHDAHYFTNEYAKAAIKPLKELKRNLREGERLTLLIIDDNVASGTTCQYVVRFLRDELGQDTRIVFQPLVCKAPEYLQAVEGMLAPDFENNLFRLDEAEFIGRLSTNKSRFPYEKDIRG